MESRSEVNLVVQSPTATLLMSGGIHARYESPELSLETEEYFDAISSPPPSVASRIIPFPTSRSQSAYSLPFQRLPSQIRLAKTKSPSSAKKSESVREIRSSANGTSPERITENFEESAPVAEFLEQLSMPDQKSKNVALDLGQKYLPHSFSGSGSVVPQIQVSRTRSCDDCHELHNKKDMYNLDPQPNSIATCPRINDSFDFKPKPKSTMLRRALTRFQERAFSRDREGLDPFSPTKRLQFKTGLSTQTQDISEGQTVSSRPRSNSVKSTNAVKGLRDWNGLTEVQTLRGHQGPVWATAFNKSGTYLATAGMDGVILIWSIIEQQPMFNSRSANENGVASRPILTATEKIFSSDVTNERKNSHSPYNSSTGYCCITKSSNFTTNVCQQPVFSSNPVKKLEGHTNDVLALSWGKSDLLLSASVDCSVRLWQVDSGVCRSDFKHPRIVTSVDFYPLADKFFLSGCLDKRLRLWSLDEGKVIGFVELHEQVTAARFTPDGQLAIAGLFDATLSFYQVKNGLRTEGFLTKFPSKTRNRGRAGKKVTGLSFYERRTSSNVSFHGATAEDLSARFDLLATTSDSRARVWQLDSFEATGKFKGMGAEKAPIVASYSDDGRYIISGSDSGAILIWPAIGNERIRSPETFLFQTNTSGKQKPVTCASFIPINTLRVVFGTESVNRISPVNITRNSCKISNLLKKSDSESEDYISNARMSRWRLSVGSQQIKMNFDERESNSAPSPKEDKLEGPGMGSFGENPGVRGIVASNFSGDIKVYVRLSSNPVI